MYTPTEEMKALERRVVKSNDLIQKSRFNLSLQQQKIVLYLISMITPYDEEFKLYEFSIQEFCRICGIETNSGKHYTTLKAAIKEIADKSLWIELEGEESLLRWIAKPYINKRDGVIKIRLDEDMRPFLLQLKDNFTSYEIIWTLHFKSKYTIRLYELIKSIHFHDLEEYTREYTVENLRRLLGVKESYNTWQRLNDRVLSPAVREINENSDKIVIMTPIKKGRAYEKVKFTIKSKDSLEVAELRDKIMKEMGYEQLTLWDEITGAGREL